METVIETQGRTEELEAKLGRLEQQKVSLENEISLLVEEIPVLVMSRYASLLESHTNSLRKVRDMLLTLTQERPAIDHGQATSPN
jgi:hypothetical protein